MTTPPARNPRNIQHRIERRHKIFSYIRLFVFVPGMIFAGLQVGAGLIWPPVQTVETGKTRHYEDLRPQTVHVPPGEVIDALRAIAATDERLVMDETPSVLTPTDAQIEIDSRQPIPLLNTRQTIIAHQEPDGTTSINIRSVSLRNLGKSDFGANARAIEHIQDALRAHFAAARQRGH